MNILNDYYHALDRLIENNPINVPKNSKINNDTVALEAGRKRGSIKKSRKMFLDLIEKIKNASHNDRTKEIELKYKIDKYKNKMNEYKELYEKSLNRELMLIERINELELQIENTPKLTSFN